MSGSDDAAGVRSGLPKRDRIAVLAGLLGTSAIAWAYLVRMALQMDAMPMDMPGDMAIKPWSTSDFAMMFMMWAVMMVGMMVPTAGPTTLVYAAVARKAARQGTPVAPTASFVAGYVAMWTLFSVAATLAQWALDQAALLSPMLVATSPWLGAFLLIGAGVYQFSPAKEACLRECQSPVQFISQNWQPGSMGALRLGALHGVFCLGCCWALMGLLFFGGVMNLSWIAAITLFVLAEKCLPFGPRASRWSGSAMIVAGGFLALRWWLGASTSA